MSLSGITAVAATGYGALGIAVAVGLTGIYDVKHVVIKEGEKQVCDEKFLSILRPGHRGLQIELVKYITGKNEAGEELPVAAVVKIKKVDTWLGTD